MAQAADVFSWYHEIPLISKLYLTSAVGITTACYLDLVSPLTLYYNYDLILNKGQYWRIITSFLFFGSFSLDFLFHMYFVVRYCRLLEEGTFRGRPADFMFMIIYGAVFMLIVTVTFDMFSRIKFLGHPLTFMMVYLWARDPDNYHIRMSFFGVLQFNAPYLPWMLLLFSLVLGNPVEMDVLGIIVGHTYYFLDLVYPQVSLFFLHSFSGFVTLFCILLFTGC
jgi:Derlin-2/3